MANKNYVVKAGDTLEYIAQAHGLCSSPSVCLQAATYLAKINNIQNPSLLSPGQIISIPEAFTAGTPPENQPVSFPFFDSSVVFLGLAGVAFWLLLRR